MTRRRRKNMKGLYIHIPFCVRKCEYCDFVSFPGVERERDAYITALISEMELYKGESVDTVFIGGGTPTALTAPQLSRVLSAARESFDIAPGAEITVEANPGTVTDDKISALLAGGVDRVSVGVQSFNDIELRAIGRIHDAAAAEETVEKLYAAGFKNISIDLMASLPYQTADSFKKSLERAVALPIKHISVYSLIIEDGTPIKRKYEEGIYKLPDEDADRELYRFTAEFLKRHGFERYEISNYAVPGYESGHNLKYWDCAEYFGIGLAAHSYTDGVRRYNTADIKKYLSGSFGEDETILTDEDKRGEYMMLGLRKTAGVSAAVFKDMFGVGLYDAYKAAIDKFTRAGALEFSGGFLRLTERGLDIANTVMCEFI